jgi:hypothetical protein
LVESFDGSGNLTDSVLSPLGTNNGPSSLDGKPWTWSFSHGVNDIYSIQLSFVGSKTSGIGLAFDNFAPDSVAPDNMSPVPEPSEVLMLLSGLLVVVAGHLRRKLVS